MSANYLDFNTGMHWTMCSADVTSELVKLEPEIIDIRNRSITVQWTTDRVCSSLVEGYSLIICQVQHKTPEDRNLKDDAALHNCLAEPTKITIANTVKKYTIQNLQPFSSYRIQMNMFSKLTSGNLSDVQIVNTLEDGKHFSFSAIFQKDFLLLFP